MTKRYYHLTLSAFMVIVTLVFFFWLAALANAASLKICFANNTSLDIVTAPVFMNGQPFHPDALANSTLIDMTRCSVLPISPTLAKGQTFEVTMKYANAVGEVGPASNGLPFRIPGAPPEPILNSVQIVTP